MKYGQSVGVYLVGDIRRPPQAIAALNGKKCGLGGLSFHIEARRIRAAEKLPQIGDKLFGRVEWHLILAKQYVQDEPAGQCLRGLQQRFIILHNAQFGEDIYQGCD